MIRNFVAFIFISTLNLNVLAQTITGHFSQLANQEIKLDGFSGLKTEPIAHTFADGKGNFTLNYSKSDIGIGYLMGADNKPFLLILSGENIDIKGDVLSNTESIQINKGQENKWFENYAKNHVKREQALSAWAYLEKLYQTDSLFVKQKSPNLAIQKEKKRIGQEDVAFLSQLPKDSYVSWFLPIRKLVSSVSTIAQYRTEEIPATIVAFRNINYTDPRLYKSGLFKDVLESHVWFLENSGKTLEASEKEMAISIDALYKNATKDDQKLNEITNDLFDLFERRSLFSAAEYLAVKVLKDGSFSLDQNVAQKLEMYRAMKTGNIAPDIDFKENVFAPGYELNHFPKKLSDIKSKYTLVVFGASWCPKCTEELAALVQYYSKWKQNGVEIVFVSLDENKTQYENFARQFPFISMTDFQNWESKPVKDSYVFGTPTMYLLDSKREILLKPISANQMDTWINSTSVSVNK